MLQVVAPLTLRDRTGLFFLDSTHHSVPGLYTFLSPASLYANRDEALLAEGNKGNAKSNFEIHTGVQYLGLDDPA